jgi:hypothetical protein
MLQPGRFFVAAPGRLHIDHRASETLSWEIFRGHLLDSAQTREQQTFESWHVFVESTADQPAAPLLAVLFAPAEQLVYVTRSIETYVQEPYVTEANVILTREVQKWVRELVATIDLTLFDAPAPPLSSPPEPDPAQTFERQLGHDLFLAVIGTSRLPITSVETPLPGFSLGHFGYFPNARVDGVPPSTTAPISTSNDLIDRGLTRESPPLERAKLLELVLRAAPPNTHHADMHHADTPPAREQPELAERLMAHWHSLGATNADLTAALQTLYNHLALTPYTQFVDRWIDLLLALTRPEFLGVEEIVDLLSGMLRSLARHVTAFDLTTFHNQGANFPDPLFNDSLLRAYLQLIEQHPHLFQPPTGNSPRRESTPPDSPTGSRALERRQRLRRRALRQGWLMRQEYEGHPVPDLPTSRGENRWVLPVPFARVPDEQLTDPHTRRRKLFQNQPADQLLSDQTRRVLETSLADLADMTQPGSAELRELGMALFLDRPLGLFKQPAEVDRTPLLSYEAFSLTLAESRLQKLRGASTTLVTRLRETAANLTGFPVSHFTAPRRLGSVALEDARLASADFQFLRTTPVSLQQFLSHFDLAPLEARFPKLADWLRTAPDILAIRDPRPSAATSTDSLTTPVLTLFDKQLQPRLVLGMQLPTATPQRAAGKAYIEIAGAELPTAGLFVLSVSTPDEHHASPQQAPLHLLPRR